MENKGCVLMQKYEMGKLLGQGTFAKVYHARNLKTGMSVAIKVVDKDKVVRVGMIDHIKREISIMRLVKHPNVVQLYEVMATRSKIYFVMEYVRGGELFEKIKKGRLEEGEARKYFQQLISAVGFCHSRGVYHRDLKPENLLLDEDGNLKVSDFGLSALHETKRQDGLLHTMCGTPAYVAPEVFDRKGYDGCKADIWSCGVVLFVLLAGYLPFNDINLMDMYRKISKAEFKYPKGFHSEKRRLVSKILDPNPETRVSIARIKQNSWFKKGFNSKPRRDDESEGCETEVLGEDALLVSSNNNEVVVPKQIVGKIGNMNAFDIISLSAGFDLSGLFEEDDEEQMKLVRFMSNQPAKTIIGKLEEVAKRLRLKVAKKEGGFLRMEGSKEGRKGVLAIDVEIFEVTPDFHLVEVKRSGGDTLEYQKIMKRGMKPGLKDIVWDWQDDREQEHLELP